MEFMVLLFLGLIGYLFFLYSEVKSFRYSDKELRNKLHKFENFSKELFKKIFKINDDEFFNNREKYPSDSLEMLIQAVKRIANKNNNEIDEIKKEYSQKIDFIRNERCQDRLYKHIDAIIEKEFEDFDNLIVHLEMKDRPAYKTAEIVKIVRDKAKEFERKYKLMKYEYDLLFNLFPELENYIESYDENKIDIDENESLENVKADYDYVKNWLSKEEYNKLDEIERNQLALNRYIESRHKSKWQIGRDYELSVGYEYETNGYNVEYIGVAKKLEDMGRDLIAENDNEILIIQCKYWSKEKTIHEKHICQLYGTSIQYKKQLKTKKKIIPVFITSTKLSDKAIDFAKYLKVKVIQNREFKEFPRIKCNVGKNGSKIYHLPFDQQYDNTKITRYDESLEFTVKQAVSKGFRRAKKWYS